MTTETRATAPPGSAAETCCGELKAAVLLDPRYVARVSYGAPDECWPWTGSIGEWGYGVFYITSKKKIYAHRYGFGQYNHYLPSVVRHRCDNPPCQNPAHWLAGTQLENVQDRVDRGRSAVGERNGHARLDRATIALARQRVAAGESVRAVAAAIGIHNSNLSRALRGVSWK